MAQRKQLTWTELRVGVFVLVGLLIVVVAIFYVTGGGFLGPKYRLVTYLPEVDELATVLRIISTTSLLCSASIKSFRIRYAPIPPPHWSPRASSEIVT